MPYRIHDPVLNIYIGTSPALVGRYVNRELQRLPATERRKVATLFIDTMQMREELLNGMRAPGADSLRMSFEPYHGSGSWNADQAQNLFIKTANTPGARMHKPGITVAGAGGVRNNGHFSFCFWSTRIRQRLIEKINMVNQPPPDVQDDQPAVTLRVNIIAFLGGGTGSGIVPSLALLTRYVLKDKGIVPMTAIYGVLPEHPRGQTSDMKRRQRSNAFGALVELTALYERSKRPERQLWHLGELAFDSANLQIADVVYLYGHGMLTSHEPLYEQIAMDLLIRIQNGHGAGYERHRSLPDLFCLSERDNRNLPTFVATSGVTEIIFPRHELVDLLARRAARSVLESQQGALVDRQQTSAEQASKQIADRLLEDLQNKLRTAQNQHAPEPVDPNVIEEGEEFWEHLQARVTAYRERLRFSRAAILPEIEDLCSTLVHDEVHKHHDAIFDRRIRMFQELVQRIGKEFDAAPMLQGAALERDPDMEERAFNPPWMPWGKVSTAGFYDYVEALQSSDVVAVNAENLREALAELLRSLKQQDELSRRDRDLSVSAALHTSANDAILERGELLYSHPYQRAALRSADLIDRLYDDLLRKNRLLNADGSFNVIQALHMVQAAPSANGARPPGMTKKSLEDCFHAHFTETIAQNYNTVVDLILTFGTEALLREHLQWGLNYALPNLHYHPYQEPETNGRIARQLDVALVAGKYKDELKLILDQESTRSEAQDGLKLHESLDPDRITVLYTEYGIPLRAVKGLHETNDSYLEAYHINQANWQQNASLPVHASTLMQELAVQPFAQGKSLVQLFGDEPGTQNRPPEAGAAVATPSGRQP